MIRESGDRPRRNPPLSFGEEGSRVTVRRSARPSEGQNGPVILVLLAIAHTSAAEPAGEDVVVEEARTDPALTAASMTVLPLGPDLPPAEDLASVVDFATGTTVRRLGGLGDYATVSLRGSSTRQVEVFLDGIPLNPDGGVVVDLSELPASTFDRVELYRGFAPVTFGASAIGGVVNLVTPDEPAPASLGAAAGSWGTEHVWAVTDPRVGGADLLLAVDQLHTDGDFVYFDDQGTEFNLLDDRRPTRGNNTIDRASGLARLTWGPVRVLDTVALQAQELPGAISSPSTLARLDAHRNLLVAQADLPVADTWRLVPRAWWLYRQHVTDDPEGDLGVGPAWVTDTFHTAGAQVGATWAPAPWFTGDALARGRFETYHPFDHLALAEDGTRQRIVAAAALGGTFRAWEDRLAVTPIVQVELFDHHFLGEVPFADTPVSPAAPEVAVYGTPRLGVLFRPLPWLALKANGGLYARPPDLDEVFGQVGSVVGNPELVPEHGVTWDAGVHVASPAAWPVGVVFDAGYSRTRTTDLIIPVQNSQQTRVPVNLADAYVRTIEGSLGLDLFGVLLSNSAFTSTLSRNLSPDPVYANNELPGVPPWEVSQTTTVRAGAVASLSHTWTWTSATYTDPANVGLLTPRSLHSVAVSVTPVRSFPTLSAEILNLTDVIGMAVDRNPYDDADDTLILKPLTDFTGFPLPGRTVMVAVTWQDSPKDPT